MADVDGRDEAAERTLRVMLTAAAQLTGRLAQARHSIPARRCRATTAKPMPVQVRERAEVVRDPAGPRRSRAR